MPSAAKRLLGLGLFASRLDAIFLRNIALVVVFHRVDETDGLDSLTIGPEQFERHCRFFQRYFQVLPLEDVVQRMETGAPLQRVLAITFDDGYRDNYTNAAPILERLGLPATFFVVSQWMGSTVVPWWDARRGVRHPWMTWDEVRSLRRRGFEIGAHTRTHADLGQIVGEEADAEIRGGRAELEMQLGEPVRTFAYPYGGREHLSEASRALVRQAGFRCCCSGFGGINVPGADPFSLLRVPISPWYDSPQQLGLDVVLGRTVLTA
jgi:peptidoglycan/xylan/chitin deacetylase (PgdA/CDA1 family)